MSNQLSRPGGRMTVDQLLSWAEEMCSRLDDEELDLDEAQALVDEVATSFEEKADAIVYVRRRLKADAEFLRAEAKRLNKRAASIERNLVQVNNLLLRLTQGWERETGQRRIKTPLVTVSLTQTPWRLVETDYASDPPEEFLETSVKIKRAELKQALQDGLELQGWSVTRGETVTVR